MKFEELINKIKNEDFAPMYLLHGEEPFFIDKISETIQKHALKEEEKAFNETVVYGKDTDVVNLIHTARRFPMGSPRQVIIVREAQHLDKIDTLESYVKAPLSSTVLVLNYKYKKLDGRSKLAAAIKKNKSIVVFESAKLYDNQMGQWVNSYLKERGLTIEPKASVMLIEFLGLELEKVVQAADKLIVAMGPGNTHITSDHVAKNIGISKEYNPFELQKAIISKDVSRANRIIKAFGANPKDYPVPAITAILFNYFQKLLAYHYLKDKSKQVVASELKINPFFVTDYQNGARNYSGVKVAQIISILREYDMKSKGFGNTNTSHEDLLKEMIYKILH
ncbi:DNA polymerase III subunit delta [Alkalitalea saponilacus]|uniref:DNA polymerase III subunit delta n=1 Tax=Alkalitalea saponilacus TaxID=889453 RepID=A0A1T5GT70_9BACT|nr:DNA polymerase III subunit delta [Alkalitalea saponilacus]ASB48198.1 DNA polymerase III subunit delta [Alkalitalea saponilacus]SKC11615.1 DNA polymerase III, delta subunit [Alkalitalea saponilacus]